MAIANPDWVPPIEMTFDTGKAIRSEQGLMLAGNPIAMARGKDGSPYLDVAWHPYNGAFNDDGQTGRIWSHAVDGTVTDVVTPTFLDGYEYRIRFDNVTVGNGDIFVYRETTGSYSTAVSYTSSGIADAVFEIIRPRIVSSGANIIGLKNGVQTVYYWALSPRQKISNVLFRSTVASFTSGAIYMDKRRVYA